ncbi:MAG: glycosyltransferase family 4 protein, partial [Methylococcaceae bacterium]|nr:glycosyltransferase family 4 protein [Methylococcaceae bacterium]
IRFLWFGDGELRHVLSSPNIQIAGWMPKDELIQRLRHIDIYLSTSLWEGLPLSVLLAMCAGKPVVLSDCIGNRELVENGRNGFKFIGKEEALVCIEALRTDKNLAREMGKFSHKLLLDNFHLDTMICQYKKVYAAVGTADSRSRSR